MRPVLSESLLCTQWVANDPKFLHANSEDSYQSGRPLRLIRVFARRTGHSVGFVVLWLIYGFDWLHQRKELLVLNCEFEVCYDRIEIFVNI